MDDSSKPWRTKIIYLLVSLGWIGLIGILTLSPTHYRYHITRPQWMIFGLLPVLLGWGIFWIKRGFEQERLLKTSDSLPQSPQGEEAADEPTERNP